MKKGLILPCTSDACANYRLLRPAAVYAKMQGAQMVQAFGGSGTVEEFQARGFDAVFTQREPHHGLYLRKWRRSFPDIPLIYGFDDLLWAANPASPFKPTRHYFQGIDRAVKAATAITVSTKAMQKEVWSRYRKPSIIVPNMMIEEELRPIKARTNERLRVLWTGSVTHQADLKQIVPVVLQTSHKYDWVFFGDAPDAIRDMVDVRPQVPFRNYLQALDDIQADVGIAPLIEDRFNECKSNLKLLEYGALGLATIESDTGPYRDGGGALVQVGDVSGWIDALQALEDNDALHANKLASRSYTERHLVNNNLDLIKDAYDDALTRRK